MLLLLLFAFLSGVVTIFAPCIWPILPIILSAGVSGGERKPLGVVTGLMVSFTLSILLLSYLLKFIPLDPDSLRLFAVIMISFLGLVMVVPRLGKYLEALVSRLSSFGGRFVKGGNGFKGGFITGAALGLVWSPCAGPILATVATLAATQTLSFAVVGITIAFVLGVGIPLFIFAILGHRVLTKTKFLSPYTARIQQFFGVIMIMTAVAIYTGYDQVLQVKFANFCSAKGINFLERFQTNASVTEELKRLQEKGTGVVSDLQKKITNPSSGLENYGPAPEFVGIMNWLNVDKPLTLSELRGKVVLVDFWTYSCINCIRTFPYLTEWDRKYREAGLVIVGVHSPEFAFEKKTANVADAIERHQIKYPVAQDNNFETWRAYGNRYWPAHYLIDAEGNVREYHFGEGNYEETERAIQDLLKEAGKEVSSGTSTFVGETASKKQTPETYLGSDRMERFVSPEKVTGTSQQFTSPEKINNDSFAYSGEWKVEDERALASASSTLTLRFQGKKVFLVMAPVNGKPQLVKVFLDGKPLSADVFGKDVSLGTVRVDEDRLYELVNLGEKSGEHTLNLLFEDGETAVYAFTFS